jgi:Tfp pilus assembly protein PilO
VKNLSKEKRNRLTLVTLGTVVIIAAIWQALVTTQKHSLEIMAQQICDKKAKVESAQRLVNSTAQIQKKLEVTSEKLKDIEDEMASGDMYSWVILAVNRFREGYKVEIPQYSREVPCEIGMFSKFPYKAALFTVRGNAYFHDFGKFVADFENHFPYIRVQNLTLEQAASSSANNTTDSEKLAFQMELVALINPNAH